MQTLKLSGITAIIFLALDLVMLKFVMKPLFVAHVSAIMTDRSSLGIAVVF